MIDVCQPRDFPDGGPATPELIGTDRVWDIIFTRRPGHVAPRRLRISVPLEQDVLHEAMLVDRSPEPVSNAINAGTDLVQKPAGTPAGFLMEQVSCEVGAELDAPFAQGFVTHLDAALVQQFLHVALAQRETVVQPNRVLNDGHGKAVTVGFGVGLGQPAYPEPVKETQSEKNVVQDGKKPKSSATEVGLSIQ